MPYRDVQVSAIEQESIDIDPDTKDLLDALDFKELAGIAVSATPARIWFLVARMGWKIKSHGTNMFWSFLGLCRAGRQLACSDILVVHTIVWTTSFYVNAEIPEPQMGQRLLKLSLHFTFYNMRQLYILATSNRQCSMKPPFGVFHLPVESLPTEHVEYTQSTSARER